MSQKSLTPNGFFLASRGRPVNGVVHGPRTSVFEPVLNGCKGATGAVTDAAAADQPIRERVAATDQPIRERVVAGILKKQTNGVPAAMNGGSSTKIARQDSQMRSSLKADSGGPNTRRRPAKAARSLGGSDSGLTNYEDDNTSLGGWR